MRTSGGWRAPRQHHVGSAPVFRAASALAGGQPQAARVVHSGSRSARSSLTRNNGHGNGSGGGGGSGRVGGFSGRASHGVHFSAITSAMFGYFTESTHITDSTKRGLSHRSQRVSNVEPKRGRVGTPLVIGAAGARAGGSISSRRVATRLSPLPADLNRPTDLPTDSRDGRTWTDRHGGQASCVLQPAGRSGG